MLRISRILTPVVFSANCNGALKYATGLASRFGAEVVVLHVLEPIQSLEMDTGEAMAFLETSRQKWVHRELENLIFHLRGTVPIKDLCAGGDPATMIVKTAEAMNCDLIVMAMRGHGLVRRFLLGSVTAKVLHDARCPVWTGRHMDSAVGARGLAGNFQHILCAIDLGPQSEVALEWGYGMAAAHHARLSLLHVFSHPRDQERQRVAGEEAQMRMEKLVAPFDIAVDIHTAIGDPAEATKRTAQHLGADLLVIGRGHMEGGGRLPSNTYAIIRESPCPVVSV